MHCFTLLKQTVVMPSPFLGTLPPPHTSRITLFLHTLHLFLCSRPSALDPSVRDAWADHMVSLLAPDGELVTLIFPIVEKVTNGWGDWEKSGEESFYHAL